MEMRRRERETVDEGYFNKQSHEAVSIYMLRRDERWRCVDGSERQSKDREDDDAGRCQISGGRPKGGDELIEAAGLGPFRARGPDWGWTVATSGKRELSVTG